MAKKKKDDLGFDDFEDDFFKTGTKKDFWEEGADATAAPEKSAADAGPNAADQQVAAAVEAARVEAARIEAARVEAERVAKEQAAAAEALRVEAERKAVEAAARQAAEASAAEAARAEAARAAEAAAMQEAEAQAVARLAAERSAIQADAARAAAEQAAAEQQAQAAEAEAAEAAHQAALDAEAVRMLAEQDAAEEARIARAERRQEALLAAAARVGNLGSSPTIIAIDEDDFPAPAPAAAAPPEAQDDIEDADMATAESFVDAVDSTLVLRRPLDGGPKAAVEGDPDFGTEEVAAARREREARRKAAPPPPMVPRAQEAPVETPAPAARRATYQPNETDAGRWFEAAQSLEREAVAESEVARAAALYAEAGRIHFHRLGNWDAADRLLTLAWTGGVRDPDMLKMYADIVANRGDFELLRDLLIERASRLTGPAAAEAIQDAALVERNNLRRDAEAVALLERSLDVVPDDWFALRLLRELHIRTQDWAALATVLARMAAIATGPRRARVLVELGRLQDEKLGDHTAAVAAWRQARESAPGATPAFLALEHGLTSAGDAQGLVALYQEEARLIGGSDGAFWLGRAARVAMQAGLPVDTVIALHEAAIAAGPAQANELRASLVGVLEANGRNDKLAPILESLAEAATGASRATALFRLARAQELAGQTDAAVDSFKAAAAADPACAPAIEGAVRLLGAAGRHREMVQLLEERLAVVSDPNVSVTILYRMGEVCEGPLADQAGAQQYFERVVEISASYLPALEGLERVYTRVGAWEPLARIYEQRAILADEPSGVALQLHRAGSVCENRLHDLPRAKETYRRALEVVADFPPSLDAYVRLLELDNDWLGLATALRAAAAVSRDTNEVVSLSYRAARVLADRVGDLPEAVVCLRKCVELSPGFLQAITLYRELAARLGDHRTVYELHRIEADGADDPARRHWRLLAAADCAAQVEGLDAADVAAEILAEDPTNSGALELLERRAMRNADAAGLGAIYQRLAASGAAAQAALAPLRIDLARDAGDAAAVASLLADVGGDDAAASPNLAMARIAEAMHAWRQAERLLQAQGPAGLSELARLVETWSDDAVAAVGAWQAALAAAPEDAEAAAGLERALGRAATRDGLAEVHGILAVHMPDRAIASVHALLAGHLFEAADDLEQAVRYYRLAFDARPAVGKAFDALRRLHAALDQPDALVALYREVDVIHSDELAATLDEMGQSARAAELLQAQVDAEIGRGVSERDIVGDLVRLEQVKSALQDWAGVFTLLSRRLAVTESTEERAAIDNKRRWLLAEHLAETDDAWEFYRQLHEANPQDRDVLEALARIAGARGEAGLAIQYLEGLAAGAQSSVDGARYHRRIAEVRLGADDSEGARAAFLAALDLEPDDIEAMRGLKAIAIAEQNWSSLVAVLAREATVTAGAAQVECYRQIAQLWDGELDEPLVAADSWRKVLDLAPHDAMALERLVSLSRAARDWVGLTDAGEQLVDQLDGDPRRALLAELGTIYLRELRREDDALRYLDAATDTDQPDTGAARLLEQVHAARGNWAGVVDAITRQARGASGADRVAQLNRAAQMARDTLHDRDRAADIYAQVLEEQPDSSDALQFRADYLLQRGDLDAAVGIFEAMEAGQRDRDIDDFDVKIEVGLYFFRFADVLRTLGRDDEALARYEAALDLNGSHLPTLEAVGPAYMRAERWDDAGQVLRRILQLTGGQGEPEKVARIYVDLGQVELQLGQLDKAKKRFSKALELRPTDVKALQGVANVLFARGDWNNVLSVYNNVIYHAQEPSEVVSAYLVKGFVLDARMNLPDKAAQHYEKSLAFDPAQPAVLLRLAELALRKQDWPEAASLADRGLALEDGPANVRAGLHLARSVAYGACGDAAAATSGLSAALTADTTLKEDLDRAGADPSAQHGVLRDRLQAQL